MTSEDTQQNPVSEGTGRGQSSDPLDRIESAASNGNGAMTMQQALIWLIVMLAALAGMYYLFLSDTTSDEPSKVHNEQVAQIAADMLKGDFGAAARATESVLSDESSSAEVKARALAFALSAEYRFTGDENAMLEEIRLMKQYIADPSVSSDTRVRLINALSAQYQISGNKKIIFDEVFSGAPFDSFRSSGGADYSADARQSVRQLLEWSYATNPTAYAAIAIARWYSEQHLFNPSLPEDVKKANIAKAEEFLNKAEDANDLEFERISNYADTVLYINYRHWRAVIIGRLAAVIGEPYRSQQVKEYEDVLVFQDASSNPMASEYTLYTRLTFASRLRAEGLTEEATLQLNELARRMNAIDLETVNAFFSYLRVEKSERPNGATYRNLVSSNFPLSPAFEAAVQRVLEAR